MTKKSKRGRSVLNEVSVSIDDNGLLGFLIQSGRIRRGLTLKKLAKLCKFTLGHLSNVEHGRTPLAWDCIPILASELGFDTIVLAKANLQATHAYKEYLKVLDNHFNTFETKHD